MIPEELGEDNKPYSRYLARELSGFEIGDEVEVPVCVDRGDLEFIEGKWVQTREPVYENQWRAIRMINHRKDGTVNIRVANKNYSLGFQHKPDDVLKIRSTK